MRHELFEYCLIAQNVSFDFAQNHALQIVRKNAEALIGCGIHHENVYDIDIYNPYHDIVGKSNDSESYEDDQNNSLTRAIPKEQVYLLLKI